MQTDNLSVKELGNNVSPWNTTADLLTFFEYKQKLIPTYQWKSEIVFGTLHNQGHLAKHYSNRSCLKVIGWFHVVGNVCASRVR